MSKISQAKKELKKKLSFNDYSTPSNQHNVTQENQHPVIPAVHHNDLPTDFHASNTVGNDGGSDIMPVRQSVGMPAPLEQHDSTAVHHKNSNSNNPASKHDGASACHHSAHAGKEAQKHKVKATYYLSQQEIEMVTHLYIKQLKKHNKGDKSAIICEAIRLIYERDK